MNTGMIEHGVSNKGHKRCLLGSIAQPKANKEWRGLFTSTADRSSDTAWRVLTIWTKPHRLWDPQDPGN